MRKPLGRSPFVTGTTNRFGRSRLGSGLSTSNSNTRINLPPSLSQPVVSVPSHEAPSLGMNSERLRQAMVQRLRVQGIQHEGVLAAMASVPRHLFVDEGLASRAYEDAALPIGYGQTISQPWVVARMLSAICENGVPANVLEVGAGCGYQAAVLAQLIKEVHAIERVRGLYDMARQHLRSVGLGHRVRLVYGDGMLGLPGQAPFGAIVVAAAGLAIPQALLEQLAPGGRLIAPEGGGTQRLVLVERTGTTTWHRQELEAVRFVPLRAGTQS